MEILLKKLYRTNRPQLMYNKISANDRKPHNGHIKQPQINYMKSSIFYPSILFPENWKFEKIKGKENHETGPMSQEIETCFSSNYYQKNNQIQFRKTLVILWLFFSGKLVKILAFNGQKNEHQIQKKIYTILYSMKGF